MQGLDGVKDRFSFMTMDDMLALEGALSKDKDVLVIGAGLIGLKCVEGILERVKSVSVVDRRTEFCHPYSTKRARP